MKKILIAVIVGLILSSCATIFSGSRQTVVFSAPEGTKIYHEGIKVVEIPEGETQVAVVMDRSLSGLYMTAKKFGYKDTNFFLRTRVNGVVFVNILLGGVVGAAVDLATGAAAKYPSYVEIEMEPEIRLVY